MRRIDLRSAAALAGPFDPRSEELLAGPSETADPVAVVEILRVNKVPLLDLDLTLQRRSAGLARILASDVWSRSVDHERREHDALEAEFADVSRLFMDRGITPVLFKSAGGIPYRSSNVDLLVPPGGLDEAARLLEGSRHLRFPHYREDHKLLFRRFREGRSVICVHLHDAVSWGKVTILAGDDVSERSRPPRGVTTQRGFHVASPEDLVIITIAHALYETDQIRLSDLRAIRMAVSNPAFDAASVLARVARRGWLTGFNAMIAIVEALERALYGESLLPPSLRTAGPARPPARSFAARSVAALASKGAHRLPFPMPKRFTKGHYLRYLLTNPDRSGDERIADLIATATNLSANRLHLRCRPAVIVSFSGLDGSGKSSALRACLEAMRLCEIPVRAVWSRGGFTSWMETAKRVARVAMPMTIPGPRQLEAKRRWLDRPVRACLFALAVLAEQTFHYLLHVRPYRPAGVSILCDRYAWDTQADLEAKLGSVRRLAAWSGAMITAAAPRPDLAILLRVEPETASRRKPEDSSMAHLVPSQARALDRLAGRHGLVVIDAGRPGVDVIDEVVDLVLRASFRRFGRGRR